MASTTIKATYTLDPETVRGLERLARRWRVSKSEALRRSVRSAIETDPSEVGDRLAALDDAQRRLDLTPRAATRWVAEIRERRRSFDVEDRRRGK